MITGTLSDRVAALMPQVKTELAEMVASRSVADPRQYPPQECHEAAQWVLDKFARLNLRVPPGMDPVAAQDALVKQLEASALWGVRVAVEREASGAPLRARTDGPAYAALNEAMKVAYGRPYTTPGQGGSIPLCNVLADTFPEAEIILMGVEEPLTLTHAPNESVAPGEIQKMALAEALFPATLGEWS